MLKNLTTLTDKINGLGKLDIVNKIINGNISFKEVEATWG